MEYMIFGVDCPCGSGLVVEARDAGFSATTVSVEACRECRKGGLVGRELRKSAAYALRGETEPVYRHKDGLVAFGG